MLNLYEPKLQLKLKVFFIIIITQEPNKSPYFYYFTDFAGIEGLTFIDL